MQAELHVGRPARPSYPRRRVVPAVDRRLRAGPPGDASSRCCGAGAVTPEDACDAHPYLLRAARLPRRADRPGLPGLPRASGWSR